MSAFDAGEYKNGMHQEWQKAAAGWHKWMPFIADWLKPATERMLDLAQIGVGDHVLDLAAGDGDQSFMAARRVGPTGYILSTDISENFVEFAAHAARQEGLHQVEARVMDGEQLELADASFDAIISRLGLMYFPDLQRALGEAWRVLKPGGRIAVIVFSTADRNPFFSIPTSIIRKRAGLAPPPPGQPGPFRFSAPGSLDESMRRAGFTSVESHLLAAPVRMASAKECLQWRQESSGTLQQMLRDLPNLEQRAVWAEIEAALKLYESPQGFESPGELIVAVGQKSQ